MVTSPKFVFLRFEIITFGLNHNFAHIQIMDDNVKRERRAFREENNEEEVALSMSESSTDSDSSSSIDMFNLDSPLARKRRRVSGQRSLNENKKISRSQRQHMIRSFVNFKDEQAFTDYKIIVDGHDPIHVHKLIMAAASTYFKRVLESGMQEALSGEIHMKQISYETVQILVNFSYGQVRNSSSLRETTAWVSLSRSK